MTFLCILCHTSFFEVPHCGVIRVFHEFVKHYTIPQVQSEKNALLYLHRIVNALGVLEDNGLKKNCPLSIPLPSTNPVKFYRHNSDNYLPKFPGRCVIALGQQTNNFFPLRLLFTVFRYYSIQVVSWILVHPILVDAIYNVVVAE